MAISASQRKAVAKYNAANYDRVELRLPKGRKAEVEAKARDLNDTINGYINLLIRKDLGIDASEWGKGGDMKSITQLRNILRNHNYGLQKKHVGQDSWLIVDYGINAVVAGYDGSEYTPGLTTAEIQDWIEAQEW